MSWESGCGAGSVPAVSTVHQGSGTPAQGPSHENRSPIMSELATGYQLRTVRIGSWVTALTLVGLAAYAILPGHGDMNQAVYTSALIVGAVAAAIVAILPWR